MSWSNETVAGWDPFTELRVLQREMNRLFDVGNRSGARYPALNMWKSENQAVVTAEIPGVDSKDIALTVLNNQLTIQGERPEDAPAEDVVRHRSERGHGRFVRTIRLPFEVEYDKIAARMDRGVLIVTLPRAEATKPKHIAINAK